MGLKRKFFIRRADLWVMQKPQKNSQKGSLKADHCGYNANFTYLVLQFNMCTVCCISKCLDLHNHHFGFHLIFDCDKRWRVQCYKYGDTWVLVHGMNSGITMLGVWYIMGHTKLCHLIPWYVRTGWTVGLAC